MILSLATKFYTLFLGIVGIGFLVMIHELGHWLSCKLFNVKTPSFSIGFGPQLFTKKMWDTEFSLSALPLGGYVEIAGIQEVGQGSQEHAHDSSKTSFTTKPYYQKMIILLAGIAVNMAFAWFALSLLFAFKGIPEHAAFTSLIGTAKIKTVLPGSPAEKAGLKLGWDIVSIDGAYIKGTEIYKISHILRKKAGHAVKVEYHDTQNLERIKLRELVRETIQQGEYDWKMALEIGDPSKLETPEKLLTLQVPCDSPQLGVTFELKTQPAFGLSLHGLWNAKIAAAKVIYSWIAGTFRSLGSMFTERHIKGLGGPLAVIHSISTSAQNGWVTFLVAICFISVGIACLNLLPLPIFDGGQVLFYTIEALSGRSLESIRTVIHYISWFFVLGLIVLLTWRDIFRIFWG